MKPSLTVAVDYWVVVLRPSFVAVERIVLHLEAADSSELEAAFASWASSVEVLLLACLEHTVLHLETFAVADHSLGVLSRWASSWEASVDSLQ